MSISRLQRFHNKLCFFIVFFGFFFTIFCFAKVEKKITLESFFKHFDYENVKISPNGKYIVYLHPWKRRLNLFIKNLETNEVVQITRNMQSDIYQCWWANDERLIYIQDHNGDENFHLYEVSRTQNTNTVKDLTPFKGVKCRILNEDLCLFEKKILFLMNQRNKQIFDVYRVDVDSGKIEKVLENPGNVQNYFADYEGKVRLSLAIEGTKELIQYRSSEESPWKTIATYNFKENIRPLCFTFFDEKKIYVASNVNRKTYAICEWDVTTGMEKKCLFENPQADVTILLRSQKRKKITGVQYIEDKTEYQFFDPLQKTIHHWINEKLPNYQNDIVSEDQDEKKFIVFSHSDKHPGSFYLFESDEKKLTKLFDTCPWIQEKEMASMLPISYQARDGLIIHGYLTLPTGKPPKNLPLLVNPHGGPRLRVNWGFTPHAQFFANRGFAVLQMNFRGSSGYGKEFEEKGFKQWGLAMQNDVTDGVLWAIQKGIADQKKIVIFGKSYGGYVALCGITTTPDLYAAAVDWAGPSNLLSLLDSLPPYWELFRAIAYETIGNPKTDTEQLTATSPSLHIDKIKKPLLIAQGANDPRVKKEITKCMIKTLRKKGIKVKYFLQKKEGHWFRSEEALIDFYRITENFLQRHIELKSRYFTSRKILLGSFFLFCVLFLFFRCRTKKTLS